MKALLIIALLYLPALPVYAQPTGIITFLEKGEAAPTDAVKLKTITMTGNNPARGCSAFELEQDARDTALAIGANLIREEAHRERTQQQPCDEITFAFYKVADVQAAERRISWSADRRLVWEDFKGSIPPGASDNTAAETSCGIAIETNTVTASNAPKVYVYNTFQTFSSWVRPGFTTADILAHEQGHWDVCELYTRKMRARFAAANLTLHNLHDVVGNIYNSTQREYAARQEAYERATQHGTIHEEQQRWTALIAKELADTPDM